MKLSIIVAVAENGVIGNDNDLPWRLSSDLKRFKSLTMGHAIVMGRKTYESIGRLLPGRQTVIITRQSDYDVPGAIIVHSVEALAQLSSSERRGKEEMFVIGGAEIYRAVIDHVSKIYLTRVQANVDGDTWFPEVNWDDWECLQSEEIESDEKNEFPTEFAIYQRRI